MYIVFVYIYQILIIAIHDVPWDRLGSLVCTHSEWINSEILIF
jgi:hypothetical protein